jgi:hypothetical protein
VRPLAFQLTGGEAAVCKAYDALIVLPERTLDALLADKGTMPTPSVATLPNGISSPLFPAAQTAG